jgi:hypothetical protein
MANTTYSPEVSNSHANTLQYAINQALLAVNTISPAKITAVNGLRYTVEILINYIDSNGSPYNAPTLYDIPAQMLVGNNAGIIIEYAVGDVVNVGFCQRDISIVKQQWTTSNPASYRKFNVSDGIILGYLTNTLPTVNITITKDGIIMNSNNKPVTINSGSANTIINSNNAEINADKVNINSGNINLGSGGVGILNANTQFQVVGVEAGGATLPVTIVPGTASTTVKATS